MTVYGITRASTRKQQASPEVQAELIRQHCAAVQLPEPEILDTLEQFAKRGVRVIVIQLLGGQNIDMDSTVGRLVVIHASQDL